MKKSILHILLLLVMLAMPVSVIATPCEVPEQELFAEAQGDIRLTVVGNKLRVTGAVGLKLEIYSVTGSKVRIISINSNDQTIDTKLNRGCYIVKVGDFVRKVNLG